MLESFESGSYSGKKPLDKLNILRQQIDSLPKNQLAMARAIVAIWYWHYYQQNTWKFNKRSQTSGLENEDISTWDSPKLFRKVAALFNEAVKDKKHLQGLKTEDYVPVIQKVVLIGPTVSHYMSLFFVKKFLFTNLESVP